MRYALAEEYRRWKIIAISVLTAYFRYDLPMQQKAKGVKTLIEMKSATAGRRWYAREYVSPGPSANSLSGWIQEFL